MVQVPQISVKDATGATVDVATLTAIATLLGEVQASPTSNTLLDRVKALKTTLDAGIGVDQKTTAHDVALPITRPANVTAYTAGDVVGGALTFAAAGKASGSVLITSVQLELDISAVPSGMTSFRLYLYSATPPSATADNAPWDLPSGDRSVFLGFVDLGTPVDLGSTLYVEANNIGKQVKLAASGNLFGYLVSAGGYTPAANSEGYVVTLHTVDV